MDTLESIFTRRSIRKFTAQDISEEDLTLLLGAAMSAPSAGNAQAWDFIVVRDAARKEGIARMNAYAAMATKSPLSILVCGDTSREKYKGFWVQDCSAAIQNLLLAARAKGIGSVWTGVYPVEERVSATRELFKLPAHVVPLGIIVLGYPDQPFTEHNRYEAQRVHLEQW